MPFKQCHPIAAAGETGPTLGHELFDLLGKSLAGDVQTTLDGADGSVEVVAHFEQRTTIDVERYQRFAVEVTQTIQTSTDVRLTLAGDGGIEGRFVLYTKSIEGFGLGRPIRSATNHPVDGHAGGDLTQPACECFGLAELINLRHGLDEHVLTKLLRLGVIAETTQCDGKDVPFESLEQLTKSGSVAGLSGEDEVDYFISCCIFDCGDHYSGSFSQIVSAHQRHHG